MLSFLRLIPFKATLANCFALVPFVFLCSSCSSGLIKIPKEKINKQEQGFAAEMATKIIERCTSFDYSPLPLNQATEEMVAGFSAKIQQETCELLKGKYGKFRSLEFVETLQPKEGNDYRIYRFKGNFKAAIKLPEVRVTIDKSGKLAGFWTTKWKDKI